MIKNKHWHILYKLSINVIEPTNPSWFVLMGAQRFQFCHLNFINLQGKKLNGSYHTMRSTIGTLSLLELSETIICKTGWSYSGRPLSSLQTLNFMILCFYVCWPKDKGEKKAKISTHFSFACEPLFWLGMPTLGDRYSLVSHILATISMLVFEIVTERVTHLGTTPVPRTIILNSILALSRLQGFPCKVRDPLSWTFVYFAVRKGKGLLCEPFAWNLNV